MASASPPGRPCCWCWPPPPSRNPTRPGPSGRWATPVPAGPGARHAAGALSHLLRAGADAPALAARHRYRPLPNARLPLFDCARTHTHDRRDLRSRTRPGRSQAYLDIAATLIDELKAIDGFISVERFQSLSTPGKLLSLSFWRDEDAVRRWRSLESHRRAAGRGGVFQDYRLRVAQVLRTMAWRARRSPGRQPRAARLKRLVRLADATRTAIQGCRSQARCRATEATTRRTSSADTSRCVTSRVEPP